VSGPADSRDPLGGPGVADTSGLPGASVASAAKAEPGHRVEHDSLGPVEVPADRYWGAQTQRALVHFAIGGELMPLEMVHALATVKAAAAKANAATGALPQELADLIMTAAGEVAKGSFDTEFPLTVWMSGSGTQCNMNVNEVVANRANELAGSERGSNRPVHPNDHVNLSQSTNDVFPAAVNLALALGLTERLLPSAGALRDALQGKAEEWAGIVKLGRTHLQDAVPLTLGQEFSGYAAMLSADLGRLTAVLPGLYELPLGGTAVGTGLGTRKGFAEAAVADIAGRTGLPFVVAPNRFAAQGSHDSLVMASGALRTLACSLHKIAGDIKLLASGPRAGLGELRLPPNEPGSSFMPGKTNPTQCEAVAMVTIQVMGNDVVAGIAGAGGQLEMNAYKPLLAHALLQSVRLLSDAGRSFREYLVESLEPDRVQIQGHVQESLMLVTALVPRLGYERAAEIALHAHRSGGSLKEAAVSLGYLTPGEFDSLVDARRMLGPEG
jgi:fumarate hydratase, class II